MDENQVKQIVQSVLQQSQYKVGGVPYHTHNGIDSPKIVSAIKWVIHLPQQAEAIETFGVYARIEHDRSQLRQTPSMSE